MICFPLNNAANLSDLLVLFIAEDGGWSNEPIPESDSTPHVNIGSQYQCKISNFSPNPDRSSPDPTHEDLLWDPGINSCTDSEGKYQAMYNILLFPRARQNIFIKQLSILCRTIIF